MIGYGATVKQASLGVLDPISHLTDRWTVRYAGGMLLFKKKFLAAIRSGEKTQTIRLWKHRRMRAGQRSYIPGVGHIRIAAVEEVELDRLTDADARPDGFATAGQLREEIARLYPRQLAAGYRAYRISFVREEEPRMTNDERQMTNECRKSNDE